MTLRGLPPRLRWFIVLVATAGLLAVVAVVLLEPGSWDQQVWPRLAALLVLTAASEIAGLRLPHRGALEMLNLYEGMVVANIALLPAGQAIAVSLGGLLVAQVVQRRAPVKAVFNLGMYAVALAPAIGVYHLVARGSGPLGGRAMVAMAVGVGVFTMVNLLLISKLLAVLEDRPVRDVVQESSKLSTLTFLGNSAVGLIGVVLYLREPMALPAVLLPAATLWLAYRLAERQMRERDQFQHLYEVGQAFASSLVLEEVLPNVLPKVARLFGAEEAHLLFAQGAGRPFGAIHGPDGFRFGPADPADLAALALLGEGNGPVVGRPGQAPDGWRELLVAPLVAQGRHLGVIVLGNLQSDRRAEAGAGMRLGRQDLQLLSPLASGLAVTLGNATQVAQIKEEKSTLEQILGLSSDGILLLDGKGRVRVWNQAMERITGVPDDDAVGLPYNELLAGLDHDGKLVRLEDLLAAATPAGPRASAEVQIRTSEGLERWLRCNHSLLYEGGEWTTDVVIVHDVTRIRQAERAKTDFVATVSHELRTPITPIKGYVEILRARGPNMSEDKRQDMLRIIAERAEHLARLVEDLLLASRISSEPGGSAVVDMRRECTDLSDAARRASTDWLRRADSRLELELPEIPLEVDADPLRLVQVLANLISNAHKYSPAEQPVRLRVWRDNGWAKAAVADRGRGIPREELDRVFEKFHRVEDPMTM
ncbi:MAG TPA: histidine kinase dimerization/phospho-acceptor domain-containing protein, partial [Actinomycetes bacterium]|nr:histidine kinase dimerization/phospho-acceptor domain-containing protein [Actinomycetes bacterium]